MLQVGLGIAEGGGVGKCDIWLWCRALGLRWLLGTLHVPTVWETQPTETPLCQSSLTTGTQIQCFTGTLTPIEPVGHNPKG